ncbi:hypothetical protein GCM10025873_05040 [Demequina sediminis]|uniref:proton-conducting transporter transmembrane domain-containing protein n=1 Tax=Demequina sediminis TaxID=1930058 RepID=UPI0025747578|nr:proton-conducting transporter membrane subunit [Demequina sediminis]BDZ60713.1 hypothetical protein GCM10025873_05040 [Demequina sediminis]
MLVTAGLITALLGAIAALRRDDLKELLAYSTISQLGLLVAMIGIGTPEALTAAVVHTVAHALFKASLFMLVGVIDHEAGTRRISHLADLQPRMPVTAAAIALAAASMAGVPLLLGFVSKETMLEAFLHAPGPAWVPWVVTGAAAAASVLTFAYSGRIVLGALGGRTGRVVREASPCCGAYPRRAPSRDSCWASRRSCSTGWCPAGRRARRARRSTSTSRCGMGSTPRSRCPLR